MKRKTAVAIIFIVVIFHEGFTQDRTKNDQVESYFSSKEFQFEEIEGVGFENGVTRRDNSDIIKVGNKYYVYYTKVLGQSPGYWGTIWAAISEDEGHSWTELGEVLGKGEHGQWDSQAVFTPNIMEEVGVYYLYYTGVQPTLGNDNGEFENNSINDYTAIGVAKSDSPTGPFVRCVDNPIISASSNHDLFDSYRVDDAVLLKRNGNFWLYYKGRKYADGQAGPLHTHMGLAIAENPEGPFVKYENNPILSGSHEVFLWKQDKGVACLASIRSTFEYAADGLDFSSNPVAVPINRAQRPNAPGAFRPDLTDEKGKNELTWGISMIHNGANCYLVRWEFIDKKKENN
ncbi:family 43 glycosylhydrolase [Sunxiuqinia sp. sy24]|uniref:family 43 glycosylhydrolase n=1 Tax=Sunxiuqinia sp. sy24 TaxID=3461495 RepID=UPI0040452DC2